MSNISNPVNPDPELYALSGSAFILKPRQCRKCLNLFTPARIGQETCKECIDMTDEQMKNLKSEIDRVAVQRSYYRARGNTEKDELLTQKLNSLRQQFKNAQLDAVTPSECMRGPEKKQAHSPYKKLIESAKTLHAQMLDQMEPCNIDTVRVDKDGLSILSDSVSIHVRLTRNG